LKEINEEQINSHNEESLIAIDDNYEFEDDFFNTDDMDLGLAENNSGMQVELSSNIFQNNLLKDYNLLLNTKHHLLICRTCMYVIEKESVFNHISQKHRNIIDSKILKAERKDEFYTQLNDT
jgi:hypothetical protein